MAKKMAAVRQRKRAKQPAVKPIIDPKPIRVKIIETNKLGRNIVPAALFRKGKDDEFVIRYSQPPANNIALQVFCHPGKTFDTPVALIGNGLVHKGEQFSVELLFPSSDSKYIEEGWVVGYQSWDVEEPVRYENPKELYILPPGTKVNVVSPPAADSLLEKFEEIYPGCVLLIVRGEKKIHRVYVFVPGETESPPIFPELREPAKPME